MKMRKKIGCFLLILCIGIFSSIANLEKVYANSETEIEREERERKQEEENQKKRDYYVGVDLVAEMPLLYSETENTLTLIIKNNHGVNLEKCKTSISDLPAGISLVGGSSPTKDAGIINTGHESIVKYDVLVNKEIKTGSYPIKFNFVGYYGTDINNYKKYEYSKTFFVKVEKTKKEEGAQYQPFLIYDISHPALINKGDVADVKFKIKNPNAKSIGAIKVTITPEEGLVNKSQNVFVENNFAAGREKEFSVKIFAKDKAEKKNYTLEISVEPVNIQQDASAEEEDEKEKVLPKATQYTGIFYNAPKEEDEKTEGVKNPQLIITNYSYGDLPLQPNQKFPLTMNFVNTSSEKTLRNIKIAVTAEEGTFLAIGSSNSFFIDTLNPKESYTKSITFQVKADATTKTIPVTLEYNYEDSKGNPLTAKDTISIPVVQKTLLSVDEIRPPEEVIEGEPVNIVSNFYNLGKTQISNLKIVAEGDFVPQGDPAYFVGNLEAGKSDVYSVAVIPNNPQKLKGKVIFTYETIEGQSETIEKNIDFDLNPIPGFSEEGMMPPAEPEKNHKKYYYIAGGGLLIVLVIGGIIRKRHKKKKSEELDLDE